MIFPEAYSVDMGSHRDASGKKSTQAAGYKPKHKVAGLSTDSAKTGATIYQPKLRVPGWLKGWGSK